MGPVAGRSAQWHHRCICGGASRTTGVRPATGGGKWTLNRTSPSSFRSWSPAASISVRLARA